MSRLEKILSQFRGTQLLGTRHAVRLGIVRQGTMRRGGVRRWPVLSVIGVLLALLGVVDIADNRSDSSAIDSVAAEEPILATPGEIVTWYCPAGLISQDASSSTIVVNPSTEPAGMWVSYFPSSFREGSEAWRTYANQGSVKRVEVDPQTSLEIAVPAKLIPPDGSELYFSVLVELDRPGPTVAQAINSRELLPCAEDVSASWYFAAGSTTADARFMLGLFNPFPEVAVADVFFATDNGRRTPTRYEGLIVAARSALYLDVGVEATRWPQLATTVQMRTGQIVAAKLQIFDGTQGLQGVSMVAGAPAVSKQWLFPFGSDSDEPTAYLIYNPGSEEARVEIDFRLDFGTAPPLELLVPAGQQAVVTVNASSAENATTEIDLPFKLSTAPETPPVELSLNSRHWAVVRTLTEVGVVAEQLRGGGVELPPAVTEADDEADTGGADTGEADIGGAEGAGADTGETGGVLDELGNVPIQRRTAARGELGITEAATLHAVFGAVVCTDCPADQVLSVAVANPSSATISRIQINGELFELAPRRRIVVEVPRFGLAGQGAFELQASTPVVVSPGYPNPAFRAVPEVFNR